MMKIESREEWYGGFRLLRFFPFGDNPFAVTIDADFGDVDLASGRFVPAQIVRLNMSGGNIEPAKARLIAAAINAACDALEGKGEYAEPCVECGMRHAPGMNPLCNDNKDGGGV